jgi:hypothetical protein
MLLVGVGGELCPGVRMILNSVVCHSKGLELSVRVSVPKAAKVVSQSILWLMVACFVCSGGCCDCRGVVCGSL